jgi:hypothetical protein
MAKAPRSMTTGVEVDKAQLAAMKRAYADHARDVERLTERVALNHARNLVPTLKSAAASRGRQAALAAQSVRLTSTSPPTISAGGNVTLRPSKPRRRPLRGGELFFGTEFGGSLNKQFPPRTRGGWWYLPTIAARAGRLRADYVNALERAARRWGT